MKRISYDGFCSLLSKLAIIMYNSEWSLLQDKMDINDYSFLTNRISKALTSKNIYQGIKAKLLDFKDEVAMMWTQMGLRDNSFKAKIGKSDLEKAKDKISNREQVRMPRVISPENRLALNQEKEKEKIRAKMLLSESPKPSPRSGKNKLTSIQSVPALNKHGN